MVIGLNALGVAIASVRETMLLLLKDWDVPTTTNKENEKVPIKNVSALNESQDTVFANKKYWPANDVETFCNVATQDILNRLGYTDLDGLTADDMYAKIVASPDWLIKPMADAIELVQEGTIIVGILPAYKLGQDHGHVNTLTPGSPDFSGKWNVKTPLCMNLGRIGTCFRAKGENWAFQVIPEYYALVSTL